MSCDLSAVTSITGFFDLSMNHLSRVGANVAIDAGGGDVPVLVGVCLGDLDTVDFVF